MNIYYNNTLHPVKQIGLAESNYVERIMCSIQRNVDVHKYEYMIVNGYEANGIDVRLINERTIVFIFDEHCRKYEQITSKAKVVLQAYIGESEILGSNHFCLPLGHNRSFEPVPYIDINNRTTNVFFIGNLHKGRKKFFNWLAGFSLPFFIAHRLQKLLKLNFDNSFPSSYIRFTAAFNTGLDASEYSKMIANTKLVLCPGGSVSVESFRLYEAMMQGCIVITEQLPERSLFKKCPVIQIKNWKDTSGLIKSLLADPINMQELSQATLDWYHAHASPEVIGKNISLLLR